MAETKGLSIGADWASVIGAQSVATHVTNPKTRPYSRQVLLPYHP